MSSLSDYSVVICHSGYVAATTYTPLLETLKSKGIRAYCPQLPTNDQSRLNVGDLNNPDYNREAPPGGYPTGNDDADVISKLLRRLIEEQGRRVVLVAHSTGSFSAMQAAQRDLHEKVRKANGLSGGICGILIVAGFIFLPGQSIVSLFLGKTPPFFQFGKHGFKGLATVNDPMNIIYSDLDATQAEKWKPAITAFPMMTQVLTNESWTDLPWAYLFVDNDGTLAKEYQGGMVALQSDDDDDEDSDEENESNLIATYRSQGGHTVHINCKEMLIDTIQDFVGKIKRAGSISINGDEDSGVEFI